MRIVDAREAVETIQDGATLGVSGFRWAGGAELLLSSLGRRFRETDGPRDLTLVFSSATGGGPGTGFDHLAHPGLLRRVIGGFWGISAGLAELAREEAIEAYNFPQGQIARLYGAIAAGMPGLLSRVGIGTYIDPRQGGGRLNARTPAALLDVVTIDGSEWLLYRALPISVAFIRGTTADEDGNIAMDEEAVTTEALPLAFAAHNSRGRVIAQVARVVPRGTIPPRQVAIPGYVVDDVVVARDPDRYHRQCVASVFDDRLTGERRQAEVEAPSPTEDPVRRIIAQRALRELRHGDIINLGQGIPSEIAGLIRGTALDGHVRFTVESGVAGGLPCPVPDFGIAVNPESIIRQDDQFMFYNGGGLDAAFLGFAEVDAGGNVNASYFRGRVVGCGGFLDIAVPARRLIFCGSFTAEGLAIDLDEGQVRIRREGRTRKFVQTLQQMMFTAEPARSGRQPVLYVTERCVFDVASGGLRLIEVAPGIDIERDIFAQMDFRPLVSHSLATMATSR